MDAVAADAAVGSQSVRVVVVQAVPEVFAVQVFSSWGMPGERAHVAQW